MLYYNEVVHLLFVFIFAKDAILIDQVCVGQGLLSWHFSSF